MVGATARSWIAGKKFTEVLKLVKNHEMGLECKDNDERKLLTKPPDDNSPQSPKLFGPFTFPVEKSVALVQSQFEHVQYRSTLVDFEFPVDLAIRALFKVERGIKERLVEPMQKAFGDTGPIF